MTFRLEKSASSTRTLSKFNILNAGNDIVGSVTVKPTEEADLLAHWKSAPAPFVTEERRRSGEKSASRGDAQSRKEADAASDPARLLTR